MKQETINRESKLESGYKWGFETDIKSVKIPKGLNEKTIRLISNLKEEPKWMLDYRLKAYRSWIKKKHPKFEDRILNPRHSSIRNLFDISAIKNIWSNDSKRVAGCETFFMIHVADLWLEAHE